MATRQSKTKKTLLGYLEGHQLTLLAYRRKSMVRDAADMVSPERQTRACELWLELMKQEEEKKDEEKVDYVIEWYEDVEGHRSGRDEEGRPGLQNLLTQLERPDVTGVIIDTLDRIYRNVGQFITFLDKLERLNKRLIVVNQLLDTKSSTGRVVVTILMAIYQWESDQTSERMINNINHKREVRGQHWGPTPFGCDRDEGQLIPTSKKYWFNPHTGEACSANADEKQPEGWEVRHFYDGLVEIYRAYSTGQYSNRATADLVNKAGWRYYGNSNGDPKPFTQDDIRRIVSFWRLYRGELPLGNITNTRNPTILPGGHVPILPIELCDQVGIIKGRRGGGTGNELPGRPTYVYLLSDILFCAVCGRPLKGQHQDGRRIYRHYGGKQGCTERWVIADEIETEVIDMLGSVNDTDFLLAIADEAERLAQEIFVKDENNRSALLELARQKSRLANLEDMRLDGDIDKHDYRLRKAEITTHITNLEDKLYAANQVADFAPVLKRITATLSGLGSASLETKKTLLNSVIQRLDVGNNEVIHLAPRPWARPFF